MRPRCGLCEFTSCSFRALDDYLFAAPMIFARSTSRFEYPLSLSYHENTFTRLPMAMVISESITELKVDPTMSVLTNGLRVLSVAPEWQTVVTGAIIVVAVYADQLRRGNAA